MRSLIEVNALIALLDPDHIFQERAHLWWSANSGQWASCPLTENGVVRIMSTRGYRQNMRFTPKDVLIRLGEFIDRTDHEFWPDEISLLDKKIFPPERIHTPRQITDLYLLALATKHQGRLVTFDQAIPLSAVPSSKAEHLCVV